MAATFIDRFFQSFNSRIEPPVQQHMKNVYSCLAISTLAAAAGGYIHVFTRIFQGGFLTSLVALGIFIALAATKQDGKNDSLRLGLLTAFAFTSGLGLGPLLDLAIAVNPSLIPTAFIATSLIFICFTICALYSDQYKWIYFGGTLLSLTFVSVVLGLATILTGSRMLFQIYIYLGLFLVCGFVLYDTQLMIEKFRRGDRDYIWHSVHFFIDFIDIFRFLLVILTEREQNSRRRRD